MKRRVLQVGFWIPCGTIRVRIFTIKGSLKSLFSQDMLGNHEARCIPKLWQESSSAANPKLRRILEIPSYQ